MDEIRRPQVVPGLLRMVVDNRDSAALIKVLVDEEGLDVAMANAFK